MDRLEDLRAFVAVVERGNLTQAARHLGRSLQSVSRSLAAVERNCDVALVHRTTRRSGPTEAGLAFYRRISAALTEIDAAKLDASRERGEPAGRLRISASSVFGPLYCVSIISAFLEQHPRIHIELQLDDHYVDLIGDSFDLAVRIGEMPDSSLKARHLASLRRVFFAAPTYFAKHERPKRPEELVKHQCIVRTMARDSDVWPFVVDGRTRTVKVTGRLRTSGAFAVRQAAIDGLGIASAPLWQVRDLVDARRLELVLTRFEPSPIPLRAVWPATSLLPVKTRAFIDFMAARLKSERI